MTSTFHSLIEEWAEVERIRAECVDKLVAYLNEDPPEKPAWWVDERERTSAEGGLLVLLMTGLSEPGVLKWFMDKFISVQNVKKWEKRILDGYDSLRTFLHEQIIPVSERIVIVLSRLRGLSIWSPTHLKLNMADN